MLKLIIIKTKYLILMKIFLISIIKMQNFISIIDKLFFIFVFGLSILSVGLT